MLVFSARSGVPLAVLLDEGRLTDIRTAAAGAVCAKHLAPYDPGWIGVCGSGLQARLQLRLLLPFTTCRNVVVWARNGSKAAECAADIAQLGYNTKVASSPAALAVCARLIITTTASDRPYLMADDIQPGTHITAVGSDSADKIELDPAILGRASSVIADSRSQCRERGEIHHAIASGAVRAGDIVELGEIIGKKRGSRDPHAITIADLTGVAAQDIMMAEAVCRGLQVSGV
ncbi:ornithine cyclodeaminase family protein [Nitratireductor aquibiodomus]|uniref:ornithine cyclodeaminase family protein n=1 Tax=Nitratireductor aquibiodomus TaxID=204799 RepID=UPI00030E579D|nr:ornithine cyclodeaminase family protein [Nitratireductor aquibiodomus]